jgi:hypothetical protein
MSKKHADPGVKLPIVFVHVHITVVAPTKIKAAEALRDALHKVVQESADQYGVRIKRKQVDESRGRVLWKTYEERAKMYVLVD